MEILVLIGAVAKIFLLFFQEYFNAKARAREEEKKFTLDQATLQALLQTATQKWISQNVKDSKLAENVWDIADKDSQNQNKI